MLLKRCASAFRSLATAFLGADRANVAMIFAFSIIPVTIAAGAGIDLSRGLMVRARLSEALDAAGLAVGSSSGLTQQQAQTLAQQYFTANYHADASFGTPSPVTVVMSGQQALVSANVPMPTTLMRVIGYNTITVSSTSQIVWGQTKLWVSLVLDNTGSMTQTDGTGTSKISALKTATAQLLNTLQGAAAHAGDVKVGIIPFSKTVNVGTSNVNASWIDWTNWAAAPTGSTPAATVGPGDSCPYSNNSNGFTCQSTPTNGSSSANSIPSSGTYKGYICPGVHKTDAGNGQGGHYYNGCYTSVATGGTTTVSTGRNGTCNGYHNCSCTDSGHSDNVCKANNYNHVWTVNAHSSWGGCVMDRTQNYDVSNTAPGGSALFPAENSQSCVPSVMMGTLSYDWTALTNEVNAMTAGGSTNQPIGLAWGWQALTNTAPLNPGTLPDETQQVIIILSDGLNTQDRWSGDGSDQDSGTDDRMSQVCSNVKAAGIIIYAVFVDLNGTQGNSTVLQNCASDAGKYFDLTTSGAIVTAFNQIATQITNLRVAE